MERGCKMDLMTYRWASLVYRIAQAATDQSITMRKMEYLIQDNLAGVLPEMADAIDRVESYEQGHSERPTVTERKPALCADCQDKGSRGVLVCTRIWDRSSFQCRGPVVACVHLPNTIQEDWLYCREHAYFSGHFEFIRKEEPADTSKL